MLWGASEEGLRIAPEFPARVRQMEMAQLSDRLQTESSRGAAREMDTQLKIDSLTEALAQEVQKTEALQRARLTLKARADEKVGLFLPRPVLRLPRPATRLPRA
jgi:hypothetical protein